jgi:hypothetical protein
MSKKCYNCKSEKTLNDFHRDKTRGDGYSPTCKHCKRTKHYDRMKQKSENAVIPDNKKCNKCNKNLPISEFHKRIKSTGEFHTYCKNCKLKQRTEKKQIIVVLPETYSKQCLKCKIEKPKTHFYCKSISVDKLNELCIECLKFTNKIWRDKNKIKIKEYKKNAYPKSLINHKRRRQTDLDFKILLTCRSRINKALHSAKKTDNTINLIGCSINFFRNWLEHQFDSKMSWDNYGNYWQIDHVIPCSHFNMTNEQEQFKCFNWKNCRPLESNKNLSKGDKYLKFHILIQELKVYHFNKQHIQIAGTSLAS